MNYAGGFILIREKQISPRTPGGWNRKQWREIATGLGIQKGRNTLDTINNIKKYLTEQKARGITVNTEWAKYLGLDNRKHSGNLKA